MTFFPMVAVALFVSAGLVWPTDRKPWRSRFFRSRSRQNLHPATILGKFQRNPFILAIMLFPIALTPKPATRNPRPVWENSIRNPFIMAITLFSDGALAKTGDPRPAVLGKTLGNPFIMAISPRKSRTHAKTGDLQPAIWEKHFGNRLSWRSRRKSRSDWRSHLDWRSDSDWRNKRGWLLSSERSTTTVPNSGFAVPEGRNGKACEFMAARSIRVIPTLMVAALAWELQGLANLHPQFGR